MTNYEVLIKLLEVYFPKIKNNVRHKGNFIFDYHDFNFENEENYQAWLDEKYDDTGKSDGIKSTISYLRNYDVVRDLFFLYFPKINFKIPPRRICCFWGDICNGACRNCLAYGNAKYEIPEELKE